MIQRSSLVCPSNPISISNSQRFKSPLPNLLIPRCSSPSRGPLPLTCPQNCRYAISPLHCTATQEVVATTQTGLGFVEIGYISRAHGLQGEVCIKTRTDFPELRFAKPGRRWVKQQVLGRETIQEVELVEGRAHPGQKCWILRFGGIDTVDQAKELLGSTLLVREEDRPELDNGEFYARDLVGMRVILKESGELVGTVVNIFNSGASDLLHVMLDSSADARDENGKPTTASGSLVWVPFVEAIVPVVDMNKRELQITPPEGLLELNVRADRRSKKERRQLEWKERKKFQRRLIAAKKKLCEMEQQHVFHGLRFGEKSQRSSLAGQIAGVNSQLLQQALQNIETPSKRWNVNELLSASTKKLMKSTLNISQECLTPCTDAKKLAANLYLQEKGLNLISEGKVATVLVVNGSENQGKGCDPDLVGSESTMYSLLPLQTILCDDQSFIKIEDRVTVPLILVCPAHEVQNFERLFSDNEHFGFDSEKVWFLEEEKLPVMSCLAEELNRPKILMKSPWEILQSPVGSGGVISLLSSQNIAENLTEMGVEYIEVCSTSQSHVGGNSLFLGFVKSCKADIGIQISKAAIDYEGSFDLILTMDIVKKLTKHINKLQFYPIPKPNSHVELVDKEWVDVVPSSPNSYELCSTIYSCLNACSLDKLCAMEITE
ncbi:RimM domain-containing protein/PRC domain-containing protein [Cephalotus follicularis]|uniref:RimM domain-containing protein/PRC domain-containing protein n=1 Tax=Cephalotus follicularis TaxID=3775 RepID=A0A1Q3CH62_CEPFO|nr:RimM domain-containing protein/PRC domain-containing protein [Cephalotus follicularis]